MDFNELCPLVNLDIPRMDSFLVLLAPLDFEVRSTKDFVWKADEFYRLEDDCLDELLFFGLLQREIFQLWLLLLMLRSKMFFADF